MIKFRKIFVIAGVVIFGIIFIYSLGYFPIAKINGSLIFLREFSKISRGLSLFNEKTEQQLPNDLIEEGILYSLFENKIVEEELRRRGISGKMIGDVLERQLKNIPKERLEYSFGLYGWNNDQFSEVILLPQAQIDILTDLLKKDNQNYDEWLEKKFQDAQIALYLSSWKWNGKALEKK